MKKLLAAWYWLRDEAEDFVDEVTDHKFFVVSVVLLLVIAVAVLSYKLYEVNDWHSYYAMWAEGKIDSLEQQLEQIKAAEEVRGIRIPNPLAVAGSYQKVALPAPVQVFELPDGNYDWMSWCDIVVRSGDYKLWTVTHGMELPVRFTMKSGTVLERAD